MRKPLGDKARLVHMVEAIDRAFLFTRNASSATFAENEMMHYACLKQLEIIGEASNHLSPE